MSNQLFPPPPPPPPPPPGGPSAPPSMDLNNTSQREAWINNLKLADIYPQADALLMIGIHASKAGKKIEGSETTHLESIKKYYQEETKKLFAEFFRMDKTSIASKLQEMNKKANQWRQSENGLTTCYDFLRKSVKDLQKDALQKELEKNDAAFKRHLEKRKQLYKAFNEAPLDQKQQAIAKLDEAKNGIRESRDKVTAANKNLTEALRQRQVRLEKQEEEKQKQRKIEQQQQRRRELGLEYLPVVLPTKTAATSMEAEESENISRLQQQLKAEETAQLKIEILRSLYAPPPEWRKMQLDNQSPKRRRPSQEIDMTGMQGDPNNRKLNIHFFTVLELDRLARFFATSEDEGIEFDVTTEEGIEALQKAINGFLNSNKDATFHNCIDIATGRLMREEGKYAPYTPTQKLTVNVTTNETIKRNYEEYLRRCEALIEKPAGIRLPHAKSEEVVSQQPSTPSPSASSVPASPPTLTFSTAISHSPASAKPASPLKLLQEPVVPSANITALGLDKERLREFVEAHRAYDRKARDKEVRGKRRNIRGEVHTIGRQIEASDLAAQFLSSPKEMDMRKLLARARTEHKQNVERLFQRFSNWRMESDSSVQRDLASLQALCLKLEREPDNKDKLLIINGCVQTLKEKYGGKLTNKMGAMCRTLSNAIIDTAPRDAVETLRNAAACKEMYAKYEKPETSAGKHQHPSH